MTLEKLAQITQEGFVGVRKEIHAEVGMLRMDVQGLRKEVAELQRAVRELANTLDAFLKRLTAQEEEFSILKAEVAAMKRVLKEKFKVDIDAIRHR